MDILDDNFTMPTSSFDRLFTAPPKHDFITPDLGLDINPDKFIKWLEIEHPDLVHAENYAQAVGSMCEYSCLYLAMLFRLTPEEKKFKLIPGNYGFWEHYWMEYTHEGKTYIIDLTLQQFQKDAPKLAIIERKYEENGYRVCEEVDYGQTIKGYCEEKRAFMFYSHPKVVETFFGNVKN